MLGVVARSPDNRSYHVQTESGTVISCNRVHLRLTNVNFTLQQPVQQNFPEKVTANKCSTVCSDAGSKNNCYKTRSGCEVRKPPRYQ